MGQLGSPFANVTSPLTISQVDVEVVHALALPDRCILAAARLPLVNDIDKQLGRGAEEICGQKGELECAKTKSFISKVQLLCAMSHLASEQHYSAASMPLEVIDTKLDGEDVDGENKGESRGESRRVHERCARRRNLIHLQA